MELNKFTIGLILVVLVVFVGAIAASENKVIEMDPDTQDNTTESRWAFNLGAQGYGNESSFVIWDFDSQLLIPNESTNVINRIG